VSCAETAEPIDLPLGLWTWVGRSDAQVRSYSPGGANVPTWEGSLVPYVCGGNAVLCQISLTTYY